MRKRRLILAVFLIPAAIVLIVWQTVYDGADPRLIFRPPPPEPGSPAALDELAEVHADGVPFRNVLVDLERRYGVAIEVDDTSLKTAGIAANPVVSIDAQGLTLRSLLETLARRVDIRLVVGERNGSLLVTTVHNWKSTLNNYTTRIYRLDAILGGAERQVNEQTVADVVRQVAVERSEPPLLIAASIGQPASLAGPGEIEVLPGGLLVRQRPEVQREIAALLDGLARMQREPKRQAPLLLELPKAVAARRERLVAALDEPASLEVSEAPLDQVLGDLAERHGIPLLIEEVDDDSFAHFSKLPTAAQEKVTLSLRGVRLRCLLSRLLHKTEHDWLIRDAAVVAAYRDSAKREMSVRLYPVGDLLDSHLTRERLVRLASRCGSPSVRGAVCCLCGTLVVAQPQSSHAEIERLLSELRRVRRRWTTPDPPPEPSATTRHILAALDSPTRFERPQMTLGEAADFLSRKHGINIEIEPAIIWRTRMNFSGILRPPRSAAEIVAPTHELPLRAALSAIVNHEGLCFVLRDDTIRITAWRDAAEDVHARCYRVPAVLARRTGDHWIDVLTALLAQETWAPEGVGTIDLVGEVAVVFQSPEVHEQIARLLPQLARALENVADGTTPFDLLPPPAALDRRCLEALREPTSVHVDNQPLERVVQQLSKRHRVPISFDTLSDAIDVAHPVTVHTDGLSLESALNLLVLLDARAVPGDGAIVISRYWRTDWKTDPRRRLRVYPVADLADGRRSTLPETLARVVSRVLVQHPDCPVYTGDGTVCELGDVLLIDTTPKAHRYVEQLLTTLRRLRQQKPGDPPLPVEISVDRRTAELRRKIEPVADVGFHGEQLGEALEALAAQHDLPLWIPDWPIFRSRPVPCFVFGAPLGRALEALLAPHELQPVAQHEMLVVSGIGMPGTLRPPQPLRLYPIADLRRRFPPLDDRPPRASRESETRNLHRFLVNTGVARGDLPWGSPKPSLYNGWPPLTADAPDLDVRIERALAETGTGDGLAAAFGDVLLVYGSPAYHRAAWQVLSRLRESQSPEVRREPSLLDRRVTLDCRHASLDEAIHRLSRASGAPICLLQSMPDEKAPAASATNLRPVTSFRVTCRLEDVSLAEAIAAVAPRELPLAAHVDGGLVIVEPRAECDRRWLVRCYPLERILAEFPELDVDLISRWVRLVVTPAAWRSADEQPPDETAQAGIAALPSLLMVRHTPAGHASVEEFLSYVESQADRFPRPRDLARDDSTAAVAALADRFAAADDPSESLWLAALASLVHHPTPELGAAIARRMIAAYEQHDRAVAEPLGLVLGGCETAWPAAAAELEAGLDRQGRDRDPHLVLDTLRSLGIPGREALARRLASIASPDQAARLDAAALKEAGRILELLNQEDPPAFPDAFPQARPPSTLPQISGFIPALVSLLGGDHAKAAAHLLDDCDSRATRGRAYIARRLEDPGLEGEQRRWLEELDGRLRAEINRNAGDPFGGGSIWTQAFPPTPPPAQAPRAP